MHRCNESDSHFDEIQRVLDQRKSFYGKGYAMCITNLDKVKLFGSYRSTKAETVQSIYFNWRIKEEVFNDPSKYSKIDGLGVLNFHQIIFHQVYNPDEYNRTEVL